MNQQRHAPEPAVLVPVRKSTAERLEAIATRTGRELVDVADDAARQGSDLDVLLAELAEVPNVADLFEPDPRQLTFAEALDRKRGLP